MRLLTWNIRQGGGARVPAIVRGIARLQPDVAVITEFRNGKPGAQLNTAMADVGYQHRTCSAGTGNGVALFSRRPLAPVPLPSGRPEWRRRLVCGRVGGTTYVAAYFPIGEPKVAFFDWFLAAYGPLSRRRTVLMGDFNTGLHFEDETGATFVAPDGMLRLREAGYIDAWRTLHPKRREFTWFSPQAGNGFRLDYVFLGGASGEAARVRAACAGCAEARGVGPRGVGGGARVVGEQRLAWGWARLLASRMVPPAATQTPPPVATPNYST